MDNLKEILSEIKEPDSLEILSPHWDESCGASERGEPFFLRPGNLTDYAEFCGFDAGSASALARVAGRISENRSLCALAWHCYRLLFKHKECLQVRSWPSLRNVLGGDCGAFYLIIALAMVPEVRESHRALVVPDDITRQTCSQLSCFCANYKRGNGGRIGIYLRQMRWLNKYKEGRVFRVGRMEYTLTPFQQDILIYRRKRTGEVAALAGEGIRLTEGGYIDISPEGEREGRFWSSTVEETDEFVRGFLVSPLGHVTKRMVTLRRSEWKLAVRRGTTVLEMHIPAGGGMTLEKCRESFTGAVDFFTRQFPKKKFSAIVSSSWIFNNQLEQILPSDSNLILFQNELYLYPVPSVGKEGLWFIFLTDDAVPGNLPRETSLQRAAADFLARGGRWRGGGMFFMTEDIELFGTGVYRNSSPKNRKQPRKPPINSAG